MIDVYDMPWEEWRETAAPIEALVRDPNAAPNALSQAMMALQTLPKLSYPALMRHCDPAAKRALQEAIVAHPNAPHQLLKQYMGEMPEAFWRNPRALQLMGEGSDFTVSLRLNDLWSLLRCEQTPRAFVDRLQSGSMPLGHGVWFSWGNSYERKPGCISPGPESARTWRIGAVPSAATGSRFSHRHTKSRATPGRP